MRKGLLIVISLLLLTACSDSNQPEIKGPKPFISMSNNNNSNFGAFIEDIVIDGNWNGVGSGSMGCGGSNINGGGGGGPLWNIPIPQEKIYVKWFSWKDKRNYEATIHLPEKSTLKDLYNNPPWHSIKNSQPESTIIINLRPNNKVWVKLAKDNYPKSERDVMIIGEAEGARTEEVVSKYNHYEEGDDYIFDCKKHREELMGLNFYTAPLEVWDNWYPGAPQNKESHNE